MNWFLSLLVALLSGGLAVLTAGTAGGFGVKWHRVSSFEGGAGYAMVAIALLGGIGGFIVGLVTARWVAAGANAGFLPALGLSCVAVLALTLLGTALAWLTADHAPKLDGQPLELAIEYRLPVGHAPSPAEVTGESHLELASVVRHVQRDSRRGELRLAQARCEDGRWIVPGTVPLFTGRGRRVISVTIGGEPQLGFIVPLPARPGKKYETWSEWSPHPPAGYPAWPDSKPTFRFRVQRITPPPPPPSPAEEAAARFAALTPESPLTAWLPFAGYDQLEAHLQAAMAAVAARPAELAAAIRSAEAGLREQALTTIPRLTAVAPEVSAAIVAEGEAISALLQCFNAENLPHADSYPLQMELCSRFSHWHRAWWTVHQLTGVDGRPPVQAIMELAQVRAADTAMDEIVVNARAHLGGLNPPAPAPASPDA